MVQGERPKAASWDREARRRLRAPFHAVWDELVVEDPEAPADAVFCFGSRHWRVPERAASLFHGGLAPWIVVTGTAEVGDAVTEADRFAAALIARGVPGDRIIREQHARHTGENVELGLRALAERTAPARLLLVAWPLASRRAAATFAALAPDVETVSAPALRQPGYRWEPSARRAGFALGELARLHRYGAAGLIEPQAIPASVDRAAAVLRRELAVPASALDLPPVEVEPARPLAEAEEPALLR